MRATSPEFLIRPGTPADSAAIGRILADGWRQAYSGFMSESELGPRIDPDYRDQEVERWLSTGSTQARKCCSSRSRLVP